MRTTIDLDSRLLERAKRRAAGERRTLGALVNEALGAYLGSRRAVEQDEPFELLVRGKPGGRFPTPAEIAQAEEDDDLAALSLERKRRRATS
jgi:hypothetical protein